MRTLILAAVTPDNTPHGYNWTFAFPMLLFIIIGTILYLLFSRPHRRIPARSLTLPGPLVRGAGRRGGAVGRRRGRPHDRTRRRHRGVAPGAARRVPGR